MKTVLITGAAGDVGTHLRHELAGKYRLRLSDLRPVRKLAPGETFVRADISKLGDLLRATKGVEAIVHLGGYSVEGPWPDILRANIVGCYNAFESARRNGVKRLVFATSNHAAGFYRRDQVIDHRVYPKPDGRYGVSKVFGEMLGSLYADKYGMEVLCIRIGNVNPRPIDKRRLSIWFSPRDLAQLVRIGIEHPEIRFEIVYGVSGNRRSWYDNSNAARREVPGRRFRARRGGAESRAAAEEDQAGEEKMNPRKPALRVPAGATDTHMHFYDAAVPAAPGTPMPGNYSVALYRELQKRLGLEHVIVVQPNAYRDDNRVTLAALKELGGSARAVGVVKPGVSDAEIERLTQAGVVAQRIFQLPGGAVPFAQMDEIMARVHPFGWHANIQLDGRELPEWEAQIMRLPGKFVIDHVGKFLEPVPPEHEAFKTLLRLLDTGRCWVKLSAPYEVSKTGPAKYEDVGRLARALVKHAPERMLWASNWPHPSVPKDRPMPDDADLLDLLLDWAGDDATRRKILADNPAELYGF